LKSSDASSPSGLASEIKSRIRGKVAIIAVGNIMRGDDGLGPKLIELLKEKGTRARLFDCGTAPENYIFPILSAACDTIIFVDAADLALAPGEARVFDVEKIANVGFSTHNPSPRLFIDLLKTGKEDLNIFVVSVQAKTTTLGAPLSDEVLRGLKALAETFIEALA